MKTMNIGSVTANSIVQETPEKKPPQTQQANAASPAKVAANVASAVKNAANAVASASQEALETAAQTRKEAATGDQQAVRKLARQTPSQSSQTVARSGVGQTLKVTA